MNDKRLTITIDGRGALPVRALPYVTAWSRFTPDALASCLAGNTKTFWMRVNLTAYHLIDNKPAPIDPREWDRVKNAVDGFEAELRRAHGYDQLGEKIGVAAWESGAVTKLPEGVFVWLDEFENVYQSDRSNPFYTGGQHGDDKLLFAPMLDATTRAMVMAGFEFVDASGEEEKGSNFGYHAAIARRHGSISWKNWSLPYWTPREAACLMVELDPKHYDSVKSGRTPQDRALADYVDATELMATREQEAELLPDKASPYKWLEWAQSKGRRVPDQFREIAQAKLPEATGESSDAAGKGEAGTGTSPSGDIWEQARAIADECFDHDTNAKPTVRDSLATKNSVRQITGGYCFRVMVLMQERGIKGPRGFITNPATIMREALQGKKWWANKSK